MRYESLAEEIKIGKVWTTNQWLWLTVQGSLCVCKLMIFCLCVARRLLPEAVAG